MALPAILEKARRAPGMWFRPVTFDVAVAFISGYDAALHEGPLTGLREWLIVRVDGGNNLAWPGLVLE